MVEEVVADTEMDPQHHHSVVVAGDVGVDLHHQSIFVLMVPANVSLVLPFQMEVLLWHLWFSSTRADYRHLSS